MTNWKSFGENKVFLNALAPMYLNKVGVAIHDVGVCVSVSQERGVLKNSCEPRTLTRITTLKGGSLGLTTWLIECIHFPKFTLKFNTECYL